MMHIDNSRKIHPVVLIAAVAITVFSLLGSAVITGLIPSAFYERQSTVEPLTTSSNDAKGSIQTIPNNRHEPSTDYKSRVQPQQSAKPHSTLGIDAICGGCGTVISINAEEQEGDGFTIKILMENGSYRTITQYSEPDLQVGDEVRLISKDLIMA
jgi:hypothetical protein